ncbi:MAG: hypothetical protein LBC55_03465 [Desulfovibrio sp.]|jgi:hypothetical protein|nr:hypothetical protein [Desulfovibrio sp.]
MKKIISYSLYGKKIKYLEGALRNVETIYQYYPNEWKARFYVGKSVPPAIIKSLTYHGAEVIYKNDCFEDASAMCWRFLAAADPDVEIAVFRDADSRLSAREVAAVYEWLKSGKTFHIMRDHPWHNNPIFAGMWGVRAEALRNIEELLAVAGVGKEYGADQYFLAEYIYPYAKYDAVIHDAFLRHEAGRRPFPIPRLGWAYIGESISEDEKPNYEQRSILAKAETNSAYLHECIKKATENRLAGSWYWSKIQPQNKALSLDYYKKNIFSQNGEDGVLEYILKKIDIHGQSTDINRKYCVEFRAWDGVYCSNTFLLVEQYNWNALYIEGNPENFAELLNTASRFKTITPINKMIDKNKHSQNSLDNVLQEYKTLPHDFDILSINIDSFGLDIWENLSQYNPKIVIIKINSSIPPGKFSRHNLPAFQGNSFASTLRVGNEKGYILVCHTGNCIFVRNDLSEKIPIGKRYLEKPELLFDYSRIGKKPNNAGGYKILHASICK